jgi:hypothetical protein
MSSVYVFIRISMYLYMSTYPRFRYQEIHGEHEGCFNLSWAKRLVLQSVKGAYFENMRIFSSLLRKIFIDNFHFIPRFNLPTRCTDMGNMIFDLKSGADILKSIGNKMSKRFLVGFAYLSTVKDTEAVIEPITLSGILTDYFSNWIIRYILL